MRGFPFGTFSSFNSLSFGSMTGPGAEREAPYANSPGSLSGFFPCKPLPPEFAKAKIRDRRPFGRSIEENIELYLMNRAGEQSSKVPELLGTSSNAALRVIVGVAMLLALCAILLFSMAALAGESNDTGPASLAACAVCHGEQLQGDKTFEAPNLSVLGMWYVERQLRGYKNGMRDPVGSTNLPGRQMQPMAAVLDDAGIVAAARLVERVPQRPAPATIEGDVERGAALYGSCAACHGATGEGNLGFNAPRLTGQDDWYLVRQLQNYRSGVRGARGDLSSIQMRASTGVLTDDQAVVDVVAYINTLEIPNVDGHAGRLSPVSN